MKSVVEKNTGKHLFNFLIGVYLELLENQIIVDAIPADGMTNPHWDFDNELFYEA